MNAVSCIQKSPLPTPISGESIFDAQFFLPYQAAVQTALELLCDTRAKMPGAYAVRAITFRLKSPSSIRGKLFKKQLPPTAACAGAVLQDIAGLRVVLDHTQSVYRFARLLRESSVCEFVEEQDYIARPKESGYRSLHLIVRIPVYMQGQMYMVPAEIQLRTASMDVWANIEHELIYKPVRS